MDFIPYLRSTVATYLNSIKVEINYVGKLVLSLVYSRVE